MPGLQHFSIIRHRGRPNKATTLKGREVTRSEKVFIAEMGWLRCAPYDDHFVYLNPDTNKGTWFAMCTCGSPAVIVGASLVGEPGGPRMLVCMEHAQTGKHTTGGSRWV